jgi:hypothetical protein
MGWEMEAISRTGHFRICRLGVSGVFVVVSGVE